MSEVLTGDFSFDNGEDKFVETYSLFSKKNNNLGENDIITRENLQNFSQTITKGNYNYTTDTGIAEAITTQPSLKDKNLGARSSTLQKLRARLKEKTITIEKALDTYGVIDGIEYKGDERLINARIYDMYTNDLIDEIIFSSTEFSNSDKSKLVEDAIFYWYVGYEKNILGQERRKSEFRLRRVYSTQKK